MVFRQTAIRLSEKSKSKSSSWAARQYRDPYVKKRLNDPAAYRARSAFKLLEINDQANGFLDYADVKAIVDLGAAPGGWSQVVADKFGWNKTTSHILAPLSRKKDIHMEEEDVYPGDLDSGHLEVERKIKRKKPPRRKVTPPELEHFDPLNIDNMDGHIGSSQGRGTILAVDLLKIEPIPGVKTIQADFMRDSTTLLLKDLLRNADNPDGKADVILSDMAANVSGNDVHDIQSSLEICEAVFDFARSHLRSADDIGRRRGGVLVMKFFAHPLLEKFRDDILKPNFNNVHYIKPDSSRSTSKEGYYLCQGWKSF